jgi:serine/threonine-protein kinase
MLAWQLAPRERPRSSQHGRFELQPPPGVSLPTGDGAILAISPDGRSVAFIGERTDIGSLLYLREVEGLGARAIPGTEGATDPAFSPDGRWLVFHSRGALRKVAAAGGEPQVLCEVPQLRGASWGEDGTIVFSDGATLRRVAVAGGEPQALTGGHGPEKLERWPRHLPGGRAVAFVLYGGLGEANHEIVVRSLASGEEHVIARGGTYPRYAAGQLVFSRQGTLFAAPFDAERLQLTGQPRPVVADVSAHANGGAGFDLSPAGALVFSPGSPRQFEAELVRLDRAGKVSLVAPRRAAYDELVSPSPDGRMLAVFIHSSGEEADLWTYELSAGRWTRLTADGKALASGVWSPDGRWFFFSRIVEGAPTIVRIAVDGGSPPEPLTTARRWDTPDAVTPDGRFLLFDRNIRAGDMDLFTLDLGTRAPRPFVATPKFESDGALSPDGRWAAYAVYSEGSSEIYARPYPGPGLPVRVSASGGHLPCWSARGDEILYRCPQPEDGGDSICAATVRTGERLTVASPRVLFGLDPRLPGTFTVSPDGASLYMVRFPPELSTARRIVYAPSWIDELATTPP